MISVLAQERLLGFALGTAFAGFVVLDQRRRIHGSVAQFYPQLQLEEPISEKQPRLDLAHTWNKAVDQTFGPVIQSLSSRGW